MAHMTASHAGKARLSTQSFQLMKLPKEVRRMILRQHLLMPSPILYDGKLSDRNGIPGRPNCKNIHTSFALHAGDFLRQHGTKPAIFEESRTIRQADFLNIFLVSRTIYNESMPIYFGQNVFSFHSTDNFANFVTKIGPNCRWQLGRVYIHWYEYGSAPAKAARLLGECFGLRHLTIQLPDRNFPSCNSQAPNEARLLGMKDLLRVRGLTKIEVVIPRVLQCYCNRHRPRDFGDPPTDIAGSEGIAAMIRRLEVLKQPIDPEKIQRYVKDTERSRANPRAEVLTHMQQIGKKRFLERLLS